MQTKNAKIVTMFNTAAWHVKVPQLVRPAEIILNNQLTKTLVLPVLLDRQLTAQMHVFNVCLAVRNAKTPLLA